MYEDEIPVGGARNLTGKHFGEWTVLYRVANLRNSQTAWKCRCSCGTEKIVAAGALIRGSSTKCTSCGRGKRVDLTGQRFGRLTVIKSVNRNDKYYRKFWECKCDCGKITIVPTHSLTSGGTKSCGCLRVETMLKNRYNPEKIFLKEL